MITEILRLKNINDEKSERWWVTDKTENFSAKLESIKKRAKYVYLV